MKLSTLAAAGAATVSVSMASAAYTWATAVEMFTQGTQLDGDPVAPERSDPSLALGVPENSDALPPPFNFVSLGFGGSIVLSFGTQFKDEVIVYETTFGASAGHFEDADLFVGSGNNPNTATYHFVEKLSNLIEGVPSSLAQVQIDTGISAWDYVKLVDKAVVINYDDADGYDVDGVGVVPIPAPSGVGLLGLAGLAFVRRRR